MDGNVIDVRPDLGQGVADGFPPLPAAGHNLNVHERDVGGVAEAEPLEVVGAAVGGGLLGSIVTTAVGIGINVAIAYFFPQKIKGPRAESLAAGVTLVYLLVDR